MSTAMPQVPPRPQRAQEQVPKIPPRPARKIERSVSPHRESYARSPLNEAPFPTHQRSSSKSSLKVSSANDLPPRPPSVVLPSLGQEGSEYAEICTPELGATHVANNLELHAPKPSHPVSSAKQRVSTVTRTDSDQAASFGIGKARENLVTDDVDPSSRSLKKKGSFASQSSAKERRPSSVGSEHGIPEIGQRVPMLKYAGDVQAPSPAPHATPYAPGIGFHNDGSKPRHHARRTSARGDIPSDAYGRFGHGVPLQSDKFEKAYYEKHPELVKKELGNYGEGRPEWALSSDDLNRIVRDTASRGAGLGTSPAIHGTPTEEIGFQATEEYASRISSPRPQSGYGLAHGNHSATHVDSPLRKESFPADGGSKAEIEGAIKKGLTGGSENVLESEAEDDDVIHVDHPGYRLNKVYSRTSNYESAEDLGRNSGIDVDKLHEDHGYSAPILAEDEVAKGPFGYELQPAVSPNHERHTSYYDESGHYHTRSGSDSMSNSRPTSRPGSIHGVVPGFRIQDHTQLEDLQEYEPLFPEDDNKATSDKPQNHADRLRHRPELKKQKFPSQDIWEDTPNSLQYTATVSTPQSFEDGEEQQKQLAKPEIERNETPGQAFARRQEELAERESQNSESFLHREQKKKHWKPDVQDESRPSNKQRFPSRDIWEDTPDSLQLQTTVAGPQTEEPIISPPEERPTTGALVYHQEKLAAGEHLGSDEGRATTGIAATLLPQVPSRPARSKRSESPEKTQPVVPERPSRVKPTGDSGAVPPVPVKTKPVVPARPSKPSVGQESADGAPLSTVASNSSNKSVGSDQGAVAASKPKPPVPSRPIGSKIAALQGGFMSDLNKRLQLGPQAPKKEEPATEEVETVQEKAPLSDARKGRARGPARRAPAKSPSPASDKPALALGFTITSTIWEIDPEEDGLQVSSEKMKEISPVEEVADEGETKTLATNMAGESVQKASDTSSPAIDSTPTLTSPKQDRRAEKVEEQEKTDLAAEVGNDDVAPTKPSDEPPVVSKSALPPTETKLEPETEPESEAVQQTKQSKVESAAPVSKQTKDEPVNTLPGAFDKQEELAASEGAVKVSEVEKQ